MTCWSLVALMTASGCSCGGTPLAGVCEVPGGEVIPDEGWQHVTDAAELVYDHNPPASGPHFSVWATWGIHNEVVDRGNWVHNLEHGGVVLLIGPDAGEDDRQDVLDAFDQAPDDDECVGHKRIVVTDDPLLDSQVAAVAADVVKEGDGLSVDELLEFIGACRNHAREDVCL